MGCSNYYKAKLILENNKKRWLKVNPDLPSETGIYILTREDENGFKYCYVGQTKAKGGILARLAQHLTQYERIDLSLKKHKLYDEVKNPYGWKADYFICLPEELNTLEQLYILRYANAGYQMRNQTTGSQGKGKVGLNENKPSKGYYDGVAYGRQQMLKEVKEYFDKYLIVLPKRNENTLKKNGELKQIVRDKHWEFLQLIDGDKDDRTRNN